MRDCRSRVNRLSSNENHPKKSLASWYMRVGHWPFCGHGCTLIHCIQHGGRVFFRIVTAIAKEKQSTLTVDAPPYWMPVDDATFWREVAFVFDEKRLRKNKTTTKPSTINLEKQKTTLIKWSTCKDAGKGKTHKITINLWMPVNDATFWHAKSPPSFLTKKD